jgi:hypothetical protein
MSVLLSVIEIVEMGSYFASDARDEETFTLYIICANLFMIAYIVCCVVSSIQASATRKRAKNRSDSDIEPTLAVSGNPYAAYPPPPPPPNPYFYQPPPYGQPPPYQYQYSPGRPGGMPPQRPSYYNYPPPPPPTNYPPGPE